ncbi:hypothetical protein [Paludibacterium yongneupense]|uniref:hypothetical protein n=1 Tax=Paludibacterium yongneupense TaxID=400061 RepID=UPI00041265C6|nr:hypothetical protein [Paludibacterium yongneupense]
MYVSRLLKGAAAGARANLVPGLILQSAAAIILALYYLAPGLRPGFEFFSTLKTQWGYLYSALTTALCGGLVPYLFLRLTGRGQASAGRELSFYLLFWAFLGIQVDALYRGQGVMFGNDVTLAVLAKKVAFDQFVFTAFWSVPLATICYMWKNADYQLAALRLQLRREFFVLHLPTMVVSAWLIWIPGVAIIYSLPPALQIPMFSLVQCFWSLLVEVLNSAKTASGATPARMTA